MLFQAFFLVVGIEVFQLFSAFGAFDVDDILLNCFGAVLRPKAGDDPRPGAYHL